jgi:hypothetical protein
MNAPVHNHYANVAELRHEAEQPMKSAYNENRRVKYMTSNNASWLGIEGAAPAALAALTQGYPEGERAVMKFHEQIKADLPRAEGHHRAKRRGSFGDELDVHAVNRGQLDKAWTSSTRAIRKGTGILRLVVDVGANGHTSADELRWRGIAGLSLAEVMGRAGYSVELVAAFAVRDICCAPANSRMMFSCVVKPRGSQPDYGLLAATVALPAFFRVLGFTSIIRACDRQGVTVDDGLGHYLDIAGVLPVPDKVSQLCVPQDIVDERTASEWVKLTVKLLQG